MQKRSSKANASKAETSQNAVIELGDIYFFYRPKVKSTKAEVTVHGLRDIQRFYLVLHPKKSNMYRLIILGAKRLPEIKVQPEKNWALIDLVTKKKKEILNEFSEHYYRTKTKGKRFLPAARPVGEGVYSIVEHGRNTYLTYSLELAKESGAPQLDLKIEPQATYILSIKNPNRGGRRAPKKPKIPVKLKKLFEDLRFIPVKSSKLLNFPNIELLIIGAHPNGKNESLKTDEENIDTADIFNELNYWRNSHTITPLIKGEWK